MSHIDDAYAALPWYLQNALSTLYGVKERRKRFGPHFHATLESLRVTQWASPESITLFQSTRLNRIVRHAYESVPYYREMMTARGIKPQDISGVEGLALLPIISKADVRQYRRDLISNTIPKARRISQTTSGTTGTSLKFYTNIEAIREQWAIWWRHRERFGLRLWDLHAAFTGKPVLGNHQRPPYWRHNVSQNQVLFSMQGLGRKEADHVTRYLESRPFRYFSGYPSVIHSYVTAARDVGIRQLASPPRVISTGAEALLADQRTDFNEFFPGTVLTDQYGLSEGVLNLSQCERGYLHEDFEFGMAELVESDGLPEGTGRLVGTSFANLAFPFIRYDTGDIATRAPTDFQCECGRLSQVFLSVDGRRDDYVLTPEGRRIMRFDYLFKDAQWIDECQVAQIGSAELEFRIKSTVSHPSGEDALRQLVRTWISPQMHVRFRYIPEIPRSGSGKFRAVVREWQEGSTAP